MPGSITVAYQWAVSTCNAPNTGYSQTYREGETVNGITYYDCSSFISAALTSAGFFENNPWFTTREEDAYLTQLGFTRVPASDPWVPGAVLWREGHTEMVYDSTHAMGARNSSLPLADQVSIHTSNPSSWTYMYLPPGQVTTASIYVVSAIAGNWWQESTCNPGLWEGRTVGTWTDLNHGYGLGQWTNTGGNTQGRLYQLSQYLSSNGYAYDEGDGQVAFFREENTWYRTGAAADFDSLSAFLSSTSTDLNYLTECFMRGWEGINDGTLGIRQEAAARCQSYIGEHYSDTGITWISSNDYLSDSDRLNNAVMIYRAISQGGTPNPPIPPWRATYNKMPVWMYPAIRNRRKNNGYQ